MAKKKVTHQSNGTTTQQQEEVISPLQDNKDQNETLTPHTAAVVMEDPGEKLANLKSLNALLLKQTVEKRQQIESLAQAKEELETELARCGNEMREFQAELIRECEENMCLELEKSLLCVFMETRAKEVVDGVNEWETERSMKQIEIMGLKSEVIELMKKVTSEKNWSSQVCLERDEIKMGFDLQVKEANELREKVIEFENKEIVMGRKVEKLKNELERLLKERKESDHLIETIRTEKEKLERDLGDKTLEINDLKREVQEIDAEKREIQTEKTVQIVKLKELEKALNKSNEVVSELRTQEDILKEKLLELEKRFGEALAKDKEMTMRITELVEEKTKMLRNIESLTEEKDRIAKEVEMAMAGSKKMEKLLEELSLEKDEIQEMKIRKESELVKLQGEISELNGVLLKLQESNSHQEVNNEKLLDEINRIRGDFDLVSLHRDSAIKGFDEEKNKGLDLSRKISDMENKIVSSSEELKLLKKEHEKLMEEKSHLVRCVEQLRNEKDSSEKDLVEANCEIEDLKAKMKTNSERAALLLEDDSDTRNDGLVVGKKGLNEEFDAIVEAFRKKDQIIEEMKQQHELMETCFNEADKKKSFWTMVSSLTTIFAAASVAYAARVR